jgi:hypothetical protein
VARRAVGVGERRVSCLLDLSGLLTTGLLLPRKNILVCLLLVRLR